MLGRPFLVSILLSAYASGVLAAQTSIATATDSSVLDTDTFPDCPTLIERFTRHLIHRVPDKSPDTYYLVTQHFVVHDRCAEGYDPALVTVDARPLNVRTGKVGRKAVWSFSTAGITGGVDAWVTGPLYRVTMPACCTTDETFKYFSLNTGRLVVSATTPLFVVSRSDGKQVQYVGAESFWASSPQAPAPAMATLFLGNDDGALEIVSISSAEPYGEKPWAITKFEMPGTAEPHPTRLDVEASAKPLVHLVLACDCDAPDVDLTLPIAQTGIEVGDAKISGSAVELKKRTPAPRSQ